MAIYAPFPVLMLDRGDDTIKLFSTMEKLRAQALEHGGVVLTHLGNHEWMNAIGLSSSSHLLCSAFLKVFTGDWR